jgi:hypothetical protein
MSQALIIVTGLIYTVIAVDQFIKGGTGPSIMFLGYALANIGVYLQAK